MKAVAFVVFALVGAVGVAAANKCLADEDWFVFLCGVIFLPINFTGMLYWLGSFGKELKDWTTTDGQ